MNTDELVTKVKRAIADARSRYPGMTLSEELSEFELTSATLAAIEATGITTLRQEVERYRALDCSRIGELPERLFARSLESMDDISPELFRDVQDAAELLADIRKALR